MLLLIAPVHADPDFARKMAMVRDICRTRRIACRLPLLDPPPFDLTSTMAHIRDATHIIADMSYERPSCYYELGLIEASQRRAALIARGGTEIFLHAGLNQVIFYDTIEQFRQLVVRLVDA